jgi:tetratricopeptide (TPR) repeat protein
MIGLIHEARGERDAAVTEYEQVLAINQRAGVAANNLAWIYAEQGRVEDALRLGAVAREVLRDRPEPDDTIGWAYYRKGLYTHAVSSFEEAIGHNPDNPIYHYHLGLAQLKAGDGERGRASLRRALKLKPDFPGSDDARRALDVRTTASR